jgi:hypothetical protein
MQPQSYTSTSEPTSPINSTEQSPRLAEAFLILGKLIYLGTITIDFTNKDWPQTVECAAVTIAETLTAMYGKA